MKQESHSPFVSVTWLTRFAYVLFVAVVGAAIVGVFSEISAIKFLHNAVNVGATDLEWQIMDSRYREIKAVQVVATFVAGITFLIWFYLARRNLSFLGGRDFKYTPRWAVFGFLVPLLNIVRPFEVMCEVWHGSDPGDLDRNVRVRGPKEREKKAAPSLVKWWWGHYLILNTAAYLALKVAISENQSIDYMYILFGLGAVINILEIVGAGLVIRLIGRISGWQRIRIEKVSAVGVK